jgi:hypothetical protein
MSEKTRRKPRAAVSVPAPAPMEVLEAMPDAMPEVKPDAMPEAAPNPYTGKPVVVVEAFTCTCHHRTNRYPVVWSPGDVIPRSHPDHSHITTAHVHMIREM